MDAKPTKLKVERKKTRQAVGQSSAGRKTFKAILVSQTSDLPCLVPFSFQNHWYSYEKRPQAPPEHQRRSPLKLSSPIGFTRCLFLPQTSSQFQVSAMKMKRRNSRGWNNHFTPSPQLPKKPTRLIFWLIPTLNLLLHQEPYLPRGVLMSIVSRTLIWTVMLILCSSLTLTSLKSKILVFNCKKLHLTRSELIHANMCSPTSVVVGRDIPTLNFPKDGSLLKKKTGVDVFQEEQRREKTSQFIIMPKLITY